MAKQETPETVEQQLARVQLENALLEQANLKAAAEALKTEAAAKDLERQEREYHIKSLKQTLADRELSEKQTQMDRAAQGRTFAQADATDQYNWKVCTHRKGGMASSRDIRCLTRGGNDAGQYAVIKHQMINGDIWVRCLRCSKTWIPPVEKNFYFRDGKVVAPVDGEFDKDAYTRAQRDYMEALNFPTRNSMSGSVQCRFYTVDPQTGKQIDGADVYRENLSASNLR